MITKDNESGQLVVTEHEPSVGQMLQTFLQKPQSEQNVAVLERMFDLYEKMEARNAEKEFAKAFSGLQAKLSPIVADKSVPNNDQQKSVRYRFASYEQIMEQVRPLLQEFGFSVTFSMSSAEGKIIQTCILQHVGGHSRKNDFAVRIGKGPPGSSEAQGDGAASTYAKRFAFCNALNITIETDTDAMRADATVEGAFITAEKVVYLREQLHETGGNEAAFLAMAGASRLEEITEGSYPVLVRALEMKKRK